VRQETEIERYYDKDQVDPRISRLRGVKVMVGKKYNFVTDALRDFSQ